MPTDHARSQSIFRTQKPKTVGRFARIDNALLQDERLSFRARGVAAYLLSKPDDWTFSARSLAGQSQEGDDSLERAIRELIDTGYVTRVRTRDVSGQVRSRLLLNESPTTVSRQSVPTTDNRQSAPTATLPTVGSPTGRSADGRQTGSVTNDRGTNDRRTNDRESGTRAGSWPSALPDEEAQGLAKVYSRPATRIHEWYMIWRRKKTTYRDPLPESPSDAFERFKDELHVDRNRPPDKSRRASSFADPRPGPPKWAKD